MLAMTKEDTRKVVSGHQQVPRHPVNTAVSVTLRLLGRMSRITDVTAACTAPGTEEKPDILLKEACRHGSQESGAETTVTTSGSVT